MLRSLFLFGKNISPCIGGEFYRYTFLIILIKYNLIYLFLFTIDKSAQMC